MFAFPNNQRDHDNQSSSQTVNESVAIPPHMGFQDLSQEHDTFEPDDNVIELGLDVLMRTFRTALIPLNFRRRGVEGEEEEADNQTLTPLTLMLKGHF